MDREAWIELAEERMPGARTRIDVGELLVSPCDCDEPTCEGFRFA